MPNPNPLDKIVNMTTEYCVRLGNDFGPFTVFGEPVTPREVSNPRGILPLLLQTSKEMVSAFEFKQDWSGVEIMDDPKGLFQLSADCTDGGQLPLEHIGLFILANIRDAQKRSPEGCIELATLFNSTLGTEEIHDVQDISGPETAPR